LLKGISAPATVTVKILPPEQPRFVDIKRVADGPCQLLFEGHANTGYRISASTDLLTWQDIGVPIVIRGPDLQADGITKNQSFGIDVSDKPAEEILVQILRLANPDKEATGPGDRRQKLVYIIEQGPDKTEQIVVTTRARAKERRNELPAAFRTAKP